MTGHPGPTEILEARSRISGMVTVTPLIDSPVLSAAAGVPVFLKAECLQETGSFKVRGAANALLALSPQRRESGVVAVSSGNHGRAVAYVAKALGIRATICLSARVPAFKVEAIVALGARVVVGGPDQFDAETAARRLVAGEGLTFIHPFDDPTVIAGQGTIGLEVLDERPDTRALVVPLSGGGLISGIAAAVRGGDRTIDVFGVSQDRGPAMYDSLRAGRVVPVVEVDTLADALAGGLGEENRHTFEMCRSLLTDTVLVGERAIAEAMRLLHGEHGLRVEGGGAVGVAAVLSGVLSVAGPTVIVLSGGNVGDEDFARVLAGAS